MEGIASLFATDIGWGQEDEYIVGREACVKAFAQMKGTRSPIYGMRNMAPQPSGGIYLVTGDGCGLPRGPSTRMYLKAHQRVSFVFQEEGDRLYARNTSTAQSIPEMMEGKISRKDWPASAFDYGGAACEP